MGAAEVETVRKGIEAFNRDDIEELIRLSDPEVEMVPLRTLLEGSPYRGHEGVRRFIADTHEDWSEREIIVDELQDLGDRVLVLGTYRLVGRASNTEVAQPLAWLAEVRDGCLLRLRAYTDQDAALRDAGSG